jgi:hypothetical protein
MAAALSMGSAGNADARLGGGIRMPVDDAEEAMGIGANHQRSAGDAAVRYIRSMLIRPLLWTLPEDWGGQRLPVYQVPPGD